MAFGNITTFYFPSDATKGSILWGVRVYKLLDTQETGNEFQTTTDHGTGGAVVRTLAPYIVSTADVAEEDRGWGVQTSDMNSAAGARRFIKAGNHVFSGAMKNNVSAVGKSGCVLTMFAYRVGPTPTFTRSLLGSGSSASFTTGNVNVAVVVTATVALSEVILEAGESIQYSFELSASGTVVTGETYSFRTPNGASGVAPTKVDHPGLGILYAESAEAVGVGTASLDPLNISVPLEVIGVGTADLSTITSALVTLEALGIGTADSVLTVSETLEAVGVGTADARIDMNIDDVPEGGGGTTVHPVFSVFA